MTQRIQLPAMILMLACLPDALADEPSAQPASMTQSHRASLLEQASQDATINDKLAWITTDGNFSLRISMHTQIRYNANFRDGSAIPDGGPNGDFTHGMHLRRNKVTFAGTVANPDTSYSFTFAGTYENQVRSEKKLMVVLPLALFIIFMILYLQFKSILTTSLVFTGILVAWSGGFIMIWFYAQPWFLDWDVFGTSMRELFQAHPINLSVAIWVGFLALFGIASDDGVVMATYQIGRAHV